MTQAAPAKLFREEAKTGAVQCPACGAPIQLHGFGAIQRVACGHCGSALEPTAEGPLALLERAQRQQRESALPLYARGTFEGMQWEIIGIVWREALSDGVAYPWQEFFLFNPLGGYRWLVYSMVDGQWSLGDALDGAPEVVHGGHRAVRYDNELYKHFGTAPARVTYVEGEFSWQVQVGDEVTAEDFICPPYALSIEHGQGTDGSEINFTRMRFVEPKAVWKAFGASGSPPPRSGVGLNQPNPHKKARAFYLIAGALMFVLWVVGLIAYVGGRADTRVAVGAGAPGDVITIPVELESPGVRRTLEVRFQASPLSNGWAYGQMMLVNNETEVARSFGLEVDNWNGISEGERYNEGTNPAKVILGGVEGGSYTLQVQTQVDPKTTSPPKSINVSVHRDVVLWRYVFIPFLFIFMFPVLAILRAGTFEARRWQSSDYTSSE